MVLDIRFNSGGYTPVWMLERLNRKVTFRSSLPHGKASISEPDPVFSGIKACLTNESVESSGETFAAIFMIVHSPGIPTATHLTVSCSRCTMFMGRS